MGNQLPGRVRGIVHKSLGAGKGLGILAAVILFTPWSSAFAQDASAPFQGMRNDKDPVEIEADRLEVQDKQGAAYFEGNVSVVQGTTILRAKTLHVFYYPRDTKKAGKTVKNADSGSASSKIKRIEASGGVAVRSGDQKATASSMIYDMPTQMVTLKDQVIISKGNSVITGCKLTVNMKTNVANLTPCGKKRVQMVLDRNDAKEKPPQ